MTSSNPTISDAAKLFAGSLSREKHGDAQEAIRFARWLGDDRPVANIRPRDIEAYVESFGTGAPNASARAEALKLFLAYVHKQKLMDERLVSHVRVRKSGPKAGANAVRVGRAEVHLTSEGQEVIAAELESLKAHRPRIAQELRDAMADKDFRENAPLDAAREAQGQLEARIRDLEGTLRHAVTLGATEETDVAGVGSSVVLSNLTTGSQLSYMLVNSAEARPGSGRLSVQSPVGQAIVGRRAGDEVQVTAPSGVLRFRIEKVES